MSQIRRALGGTRVEGVAVGLDDEPFANEEVDPMAEERHLLPDVQLQGSESMEQQRLKE